MEYNEFEVFINSYRNIQTKIKEIDIEDKTSEIERIKKDIKYNELEIQKLEMYREGVFKDVRKFEEASKPFMEKIKQDEERIQKLKDFNEGLEERKKRLEELEGYKENIKKSMKAERNAQIERLQNRKELLNEENEKAKADAFSKIKNDIKNFEEQYKNFVKQEEENPKAVKDHNYKEFLQNKIIKLKAELVNQQENFKSPVLREIKDIETKIKSVNQAYKEALSDF